MRPRVVVDRSRRTGGPVGGVLAGYAALRPRPGALAGGQVRRGVTQGHNHSVAEFTTLFYGKELVPPGVVEARQWHPGWSDLPTMPSRDGQAIAGVARITERPARLPG